MKIHLEIFKIFGLVIFLSFIILMFSTDTCFAKSLQRLGIPAQSDIILPAYKASTPIRALCLDEDLYQPIPISMRTYLTQEFLYNNLHTSDSIIVSDKTGKILKFDDLVVSTASQKPKLKVEGFSYSIYYYVQFTNLSSENLTVKIVKPTVFAQVAGEENSVKILNLLNTAGKTHASFNDAIENSYQMVQNKIWLENADLYFLRMITDYGIRKKLPQYEFWTKARDAVTPSAVSEAKLKARKTFAASTDEELLIKMDDFYKNNISKDSYLRDKINNWQKLKEDKRQTVLVTYEQTANCKSSILDVPVAKVQIFGTKENIDLYMFSQNSRKPIFNSTCKPSFKVGGDDVFPPDGNNSGNNGDGKDEEIPKTPPPSFPNFWEKVSKDKDCSVEYCMNSKAESKFSVECNGFGIGYSSNKKIEIKAFGVTSPGI